MIRIVGVTRLALLMFVPLAAFAGLAVAEAVLPDETRPVTALNVSIAVFDPGLPDDQSQYRELNVFPRIRGIEAMFLPFVLRQTLVESNEWGAVRLVPEPDLAAELLVTGVIVGSDGETLELRIRAVDASGRLWFEQTFAGIVSDDYAQRDREAGVPAYQQLYDAIAAELLAARARLDDESLSDIVEISLLRYAGELAPSAFGDHLSRADDGTFTIERLPARNDPMLPRIERLRSTEYVIIDAVDAKFRELHGEIASVYDVWREYRRKSIEYQEEDARHARETRSDARQGSYEALRNVYDNYKWHRITARELDHLAVAFNNEVGPTIDAMEVRVAEMEGWVDMKYAEWHRILEELFDVETGL